MKRSEIQKKLKKMEISSLADAEFKTLVIRMLKELNEDLSSIKKIQSETKDIPIETKNNLQGNNSRENEPEKSMIWNIKKQKTIMQNKRKKKSESKKTRIV